MTVCVSEGAETDRKMSNVHMAGDYFEIHVYRISQVGYLLLKWGRFPGLTLKTFND